MSIAWLGLVITSVVGLGSSIADDRMDGRAGTESFGRTSSPAPPSGY
jgi:hypothetical protein